MKTILLFFVGIIGILILLTSCSDTTSAQFQNKFEMEQIYSKYGDFVYTFKYKGKECFVYDGFKAGGISCLNDLEKTK